VQRHIRAGRIQERDGKLYADDKKQDAKKKPLSLADRSRSTSRSKGMDREDHHAN
jgi:hypothetical protein